MASALMSDANISSSDFINRDLNRHSRFAKQRSRFKKAAYIEIKNQIRRDAPLLRGKLTTHHVLDGKNNWMDGHFLSRRRPWFYSLALITTRCAYVDLVHQRAMDRSYELAPEREPDFFDRAVSDPKTGRSVVHYVEPLRYPELDGMARYDWADNQHAVIANSGEISVHEQWTLHRDYRAGIGLHATIDVPFLTVESINQFIDRFLVDEAEFNNPTPLNYRYEDIPSWGIDANAVIGIAEEGNL